MFRNYTVIIGINNDSLNFNKTHPNKITGNSLSIKMCSWSLELNKNCNSFCEEKTKNVNLNKISK